MSSHEARTDPKQCPPGVSMAFTRRPSLPLLITNNNHRDKYRSRCHSQIAFPTNHGMFSFIKSISCPHCGVAYHMMNPYFGNYPLLNMWFPYKDFASINTSSQSTTTS
ncbi:hypothetical protein T03_1617 [Trichinella britovi]|uniref:Uncharacterized protein n=1 Tax=Trichinella britovi TaxID=45882 RepID=A0A0V1DBU8_TRIBR|nr:hypothetical protein T03_1617 [Trichinella britovi]